MTRSPFVQHQPLSHVRRGDGHGLRHICHDEGHESHDLLHLREVEEEGVVVQHGQIVRRVRGEEDGLGAVQGDEALVDETEAEGWKPGLKVLQYSRCKIKVKVS